MVARSHLALHHRRGGARRQLLARGHVVDAPADVALAQVAPRRPPGEERVVVGIEPAADVDEPFAEEALEQLALLGTPSLVQPRSFRFTLAQPAAPGLQE